MFGTLEISASALTAHRTHLDVIAGNIAMKDVTRDENGRSIPYRRRTPLFSVGRSPDQLDAPGVHVSAIVEDPSPFGMRWEPGHVDAIREGELKGYLRVSNVDYHTEMVNAMQAARAYEANITVIEVTKAMASATLRLIA